MPRRAVILPLLLWAWLAVVPDRAAGAAPLSKDRAVVVLVGVAGDVESDKAFADDLNGLLDGLSAPEAAPKSLTLLVENPAAVDRKLPFPTRVLSNRRESFLSLKGSDPDLVIAWGHGGQQGAQPVLHVPGPRLTPADFLALASPASTKPSDWVLYFRGSQAFAQAVGSPARRVLASEGAKTFTFDPVGVPMLLRALPPATDLPALAAATDKAVGQWYASRSLAPTEQVTLWLDGRPVPPLSPEAAAWVARATDHPAAKDANPAAPAWHGPDAVDPAAYPDVDAVVLRESIQAVIGDNPQLSQEEERYVQILTPEGKRFGDLDLAFSPPEENLTVLDCEVRQPDGHVERVDTDAHDEAPAPGGPPEEYPARQRKFFSVPNVVPGAILHLHERREWKHFPLPKVYLSLPLADELPILDKTLEIRVPSGLPFHFGWKNLPAGDNLFAAEPRVEVGAYGSTYRWHFTSLPPLSTEPLRPPDDASVLLASTFGDWGEFLTWYQGLIRASSQATPEMVAKARELTAGCTDDLDKIRALFRYVTELRYVAVPLGVNAYRPHAAANVFHHRYGDCKDKANLLNTLLASLGFDARLVLAPRFAVALPEVPGAAFNHAISHVNFQGKSLWLDSTDDICRFGLLPPGDPGSRVLLVADHEHDLHTLPSPPAQDSRLDLTRALTLAPGEGVIEDKSECRATGIMDYQLRAAARHLGAGRARTGLLDGLARPLAGAETLRTQTFLSPAEMQQDFTWKAEGRWDGLVSELPPHTAVGGRLVRLPFLLPAEWFVAQQPRGSGLYLDGGYPCEIVQRVTLRCDGGKLSLPADAASTGGPLQYRLEWRQVDAATVAATLTLTLSKADLPLADTALFQDTLRTLHGCLARGVLLTGEPAAPVTHP